MLFLLLITLVSIVPNVPMPFSFPVRFSNSFLSVYNRITIYIPFLFLLGLFVSAIITVFFKKKRKTGIKLLFLMFIFIGITFLSSKYISPILIDYSKGYNIKKLNPLIDALEKFKTDNNVYPELIHLLVPKYIDAIPKPSALTIRNVEYKRNGESYTLLFMQYLDGWDADVVLYNSNNVYDETYYKLKTYGNWRYYFRE